MRKISSWSREAKTAVIIPTAATVLLVGLAALDVITKKDVRTLASGLLPSATAHPSSTAEWGIGGASPSPSASLEASASPSTSASEAALASASASQSPAAKPSKQPAPNPKPTHHNSPSAAPTTPEAGDSGSCTVNISDQTIACGGIVNAYAYASGTAQGNTVAFRVVKAQYNPCDVIPGDPGASDMIGVTQNGATDYMLLPVAGDPSANAVFFRQQCR